MKARILFFGVLLLTGLTAAAQPNENIFDRDERLVWLGLDFTAAKLVGDTRAWGSAGHIHRFMASLNYLLIKEQKKYNIAEAMNRRQVDTEIELAIDHNSKLNMENAVDDRLNGHFLDEKDIQQIVNLYDFKEVSGTGILFVVESFNKPALRANVWVTFVNLETRGILLTKKMVEEPAGFGVRNFWAGSIYKIMRQIKKKDYNLWRREYARKK